MWWVWHMFGGLPLRDDYAEVHVIIREVVALV